MGGGYHVLEDSNYIVKALSYVRIRMHTRSWMADTTRQNCDMGLEAYSSRVVAEALM